MPLFDILKSITSSNGIPVPSVFPLASKSLALSVLSQKHKKAKKGSKKAKKHAPQKSKHSKKPKGTQSKPKSSHKFRFGVDTNDPNLNPSVAKKGGATFVVRYISQQATAPMSPAEAKNWSKHGMDLVAVWETSFTRPVDGGSKKANFANGVADARAAKAQMKALGAGKKPVYFAVDSFVQPKHPDKLPADRVIKKLASVYPYFDGILSVLGRKRTGAYGSYTLIKGLFDKNKIAYGWQSADFDAHGRVDPRIHLYQYDIYPPDSFGVGQLDYDQARQADFGQWRSKLHRKK
jgi:hypothetical protein